MFLLFLIGTRSLSMNIVSILKNENFSFWYISQFLCELFSSSTYTFILIEIKQFVVIRKIVFYAGIYFSAFKFILIAEIILKLSNFEQNEISIDRYLWTSYRLWIFLMDAESFVSKTQGSSIFRIILSKWFLLLPVRQIESVT